MKTFTPSANPFATNRYTLKAAIVALLSVCSLSAAAQTITNFETTGNTAIDNQLRTKPIVDKDGNNNNNLEFKKSEIVTVFDGWSTITGSQHTVSADKKSLTIHPSSIVISAKKSIMSETKISFTTTSSSAADYTTSILDGSEKVLQTSTTKGGAHNIHSFTGSFPNGFQIKIENNKNGNQKLEVTNFSITGYVSPVYQGYTLQGQYMNAKWINSVLTPDHKLELYRLNFNVPSSNPIDIEYVKSTPVVTEGNASLSMAGLEEGIYVSRVVALDTIGHSICAGFDLRLVVIQNKGDLVIESTETKTINPPACHVWRYDHLTLKMEDVTENSPKGAFDRAGQINYALAAGHSQLGGMTFKKSTIEMHAFKWKAYFMSFPFTPSSITFGEYENNVLQTPSQKTLGNGYSISFFDPMNYSIRTGNYFGNLSSTNDFANLKPGLGYQFSVPDGPVALNPVVIYMEGDESIPSDAENFKYLTYGKLSAAITAFFNSEQSAIETYNGWNILANPFPRYTKVQNLLFNRVIVWNGIQYHDYSNGDSIPTFVSVYAQTNQQRVLDITSGLTSASTFSNSITPADLRLNLSDGSYNDRITFSLAEESSQFYTIGNDLLKMFAASSVVPQLYTKLEKTNLAVRSLSIEDAEAGVNFFAKIGKTGRQTFSINKNEWPSNYNFYLRDANGDKVNLSEGAYSFEGVQGATVEFTLSAVPMIPMENTTEPKVEKKEKKIKVYVDGKKVIVESPEEEIKQVTIVDLLGNVVYKGNGSKDKTVITVAKSGTYLVQTYTATDQPVEIVVVR